VIEARELKPGCGGIYAVPVVRRQGVERLDERLAEPLSDMLARAESKARSRRFSGQSITGFGALT
jgi:hypothetical protein